MSNSRMTFYESLARLSLLVVFTFAMVAATVGFVSICHMLMQGEVPRLELIYERPQLTVADLCRVRALLGRHMN